MDQTRDEETQSSVNAELAKLEDARQRRAREAPVARADLEMTIARAHDDLTGHVRRVLQDADEQLAALAAAAVRSAGVERERIETAIAALRSERDMLEKNARALRDASAETWHKVRDDFEMSLRGLRFLREKSASIVT